MSDLKYTSTPPTEEGWYWITNNSPKPEIIYVEKSIPSPQRSFIVHSTFLALSYSHPRPDVKTVTKSINAKWAGPIPKPLREKP